MGKALEKNLDNLEFNWGGDKPYDEINKDDFSAIFTGLLMAPLNDEYQFHVQSDAAVSIKINGASVLDHYLTVPTELGAWKLTEYGKITHSEKVQLNSGMQYKFEIKYWRTPSHEFIFSDKSFLKVRWSSNKIPEQQVFLIIIL